MRVTLLYFAAARERTGKGSEIVELPDGATAGDAREAACAAHPALRAVADKLRLAVDQEFANAGRKLRDGSEVALIPPVSGGSGAGPHRISPEPLEVAAALRDVEGTDAGAVVSFVGTVRDNARGKNVVRLDYEAYPEMALKVFARIAEEAARKWAGVRIAIHHRVGKLEPGALSVVIAAAAPHRAEAFEACRLAIEELKKDAPIWKREHYPDGSSWVGLGS
jgi:molybdopterin converting factor subunit 1